MELTDGGTLTPNHPLRYVHTQLSRNLVLRRMPGLLILLACCRCAALPVDHPHTAEALVHNAVVIYERDDLLQDDFYSDDNLKRLSGAATVKRLRLEKPAGVDWGEWISTTDFVNIEPPTKVWRPNLDIPPVRYERSREVKDEKIVSAHLFVVFQADYAGTRRSVIAPLLRPACREDKGQESAKLMAITREPFNSPLGQRRPTIVSCVGARKKMILDFGLAEAGTDPMLGSIQIIEEAK
jgi:hypothetical protein